jgi:hypothetical protein
MNYNKTTNCKNNLDILNYIIKKYNYYLKNTTKIRI